MVNLTGFSLPRELQARNIQERSSIYTKLEGVSLRVTGIMVDFPPGTGQHLLH